MKKQFGILSIGLALSLLTACESKVVNQPALQGFSQEQASDARRAAEQFLNGKGHALFICGQSDGLGIFASSWHEGFIADGMKDGRLVFAIDRSGKADVIFRDATGKYTSSREDSATVTRIAHDATEIWIIAYDKTGIVETHNIVAVENQLVDLWTANKPTSVVGPSAKIFRASCVRP